MKGLSPNDPFRALIFAVLASLPIWALLIWAAVALAPTGHSEPLEVPLAITCDHREPGHVDKHGGQLADDAYHRERGEAVTCQPPAEESRHEQSRDDHPRRHVDRPGIHCRFLVMCG